MLAMYGKARVGNGVVALAKSLNIPIRLVDDADTDFRASDYEAVIPTPGVNPNSRAYAAGNVLSELDFAHRYLPRGFKVVAITGTDGKSTTAWITYELLRQEFGDDKVFLSGNFEIPFSETVLDIRNRGLKRGYIVLEVSSFMAYGIGKTHAIDSLPTGEREGGFLTDYTVFTNFQTDHINWHGSFEAYFDAKKNLVDHTRKVSLVEEGIVGKAASLGRDFTKNSIRAFGLNQDLKDRVSDQDIVVSGRRKYRLDETRFRGAHNALNILAASLVTNELGVCSKRTKTYLANISGLPHRLELVKKENWISYVDDSKSTSAQSLRAALGSYDSKSVSLIAGGSDKGDEFDSLEDLFRSRVKFVVCIWATRDKFRTLADRAGIPNAIANSMPEAVQLAHEHAKQWGTVLLSPGCASFGMFKDYLDRANQFRQAVYDITKS